MNLNKQVQINESPLYKFVLTALKVNEIYLFRREESKGLATKERRTHSV
jgi:hypothetical protein